jgi:hypothetical protein
MKTMRKQLLENWDAYEVKKKESGGDPAFFSCNEAWELFYLGEKVQQIRPDLELLTILEVIEKCCRNETAPLYRTEFIDRVIEELSHSTDKR